MKLKRISDLVTLFIAFNLILTGCGSVSETASNTTEITTDTVIEEVLTPVKGGTLRLCMKKPATLNPVKNNDVTVDNVLKLVFEPLFNINNNMELEPNIAESIEVNGKAVHIKIKDGLTWADGKAIGADDVLYTLDMIWDTPADTIYKNALANVQSFEQTGDKTLSIYYTEPVGAVGYNLAIPVLPKHYYKSNENADMNPMGCGSFAFESYSGKTLKLKASKGIKGEPYISDVTVEIIKDDETMIDAVENNVVDCLSLNAENMGAIKGNITSKAKMYTSNLFEYVGFNVRNDLFATSDLRKAMVHLMPLDNIVKGIYINNISKSITPVNPDNVYVNQKGVDTYDNDTSTANTLILASGLTKNDFSFKILVNNENKSRLESAKMISEAFNEYGMDTSVDAVSFEEYKKRLFDHDFDMYLGCTELTPTMNLAPLLGSNGYLNYSGYQNSQMDEYINRVDMSSDFASYETNINNLNKFISYEVPIVGIGFKKKALVCSDNIKGDITPVFGNCYYNINNWFLS